VIGEQDIVEIDFASLCLIYEITIGVVDRVESETCKIHGYEIEVHSLNTMETMIYLLRLKF
jgi:hypothetical protein